MPVPLFIRHSLAHLTKLAWKQPISSKFPGAITSPHSTSSDKVLEFVDPALANPQLGGLCAQARLGRPLCVLLPNPTFDRDRTSMF